MRWDPVRPRRPFLLACLVAAALSGSGAARADDLQLRLQTSLDVRDVWVRQMPQIQLNSPVDTSLRTLPPGTLPSTGSQQFLAFTWDTAATANDRWLIPLFGLQFGWAIGSSPAVVTSLDGSIVQMRPWSSDLFTVLLPGFGVRIKERRWMIEAAVRGVVSVAWMNITVASGASSQDLTDGQPLFAVGLGLRADLEACRRIDPVQRACVFVSPALYEFSPFNGGSIGLRWEVGP
jgi:hypothetical protein